MSAASRRRSQVVVDMTPLEANGLNGGAGLVATSLVAHLSSLAPELEFTLLTSLASHAELAQLEASNVRRRCVVTQPGSPTLARKVADTVLPPGARVHIKRAYWRLRTARGYGRLTDDLQSDLLLCPFTVPYFWRRGVPCVAIVHDLQEVTYPEFFTPEQRLNRRQHLRDACARADRLICVSDYVRRSLLANFDVPEDRVVAIPHGLLHATGPADARVIDRLGLSDGHFLLYPANFWPHKNHLRLFEALRERGPTDVTLVCTGAPNAYMRTLKRAAAELLPPGAVVFAGYVRQEELAALFDACNGLIFPSLYEGFGMPVLEAMAHGKPVLCSNVTSLPEVAGDAGIYFDPTDPRQILSALDVLERDPARLADLIRRGEQRVATFGDAGAMATRYLAVFEQLLAASPA